MKLKQHIKNFFTVTPKEWVAVQVFCAAIVTSLTFTWETLSNVMGPEDSDMVKVIMKIALGMAAFLAAFAQTRVKK